jgi:hypothetical protein
MPATVSTRLRCDQFIRRHVDLLSPPKAVLVYVEAERPLEPADIVFRGQLSARRIFRGQNPEGSQACRFASGAADEVRASDQLEDSETNRRDDSTGGARPSE